MRPARRPARLRVLATLLLLGLLGAGGCTPGCTTFSGQTLLLRHDAARDTLDVLLVYRGLAPQGPLDEAVARLAKVRFQRVVALGSPMFTLDMDGVLDPGTDAPAEPARPRDGIRAALAALQVHDFGMWEDEAGRLCGAQGLHLEGVAEALRLVNVELRDWLISDPDALRRLLEDFGLGAPDEVAAAQATLMSAADFACVALERGAIVLALPIAPGQRPRARAVMLGALGDLHEKALAGDRDAAEARRFLAAHDLGLSTVDDRLRLVIGDTARDELVLDWPPDGPVDQQLAAALRAQQWEIAGPEGEDAARAAFEKLAAGEGN